MMIAKGDVVKARGVDGFCTVTQVGDLFKLETQTGKSTWRGRDDIDYIGTPNLKTFFVVADDTNCFQQFSTLEKAKDFIHNVVDGREGYAITIVDIQCGYTKRE